MDSPYRVHDFMAQPLSCGPFWCYPFWSGPFWRELHENNRFLLIFFPIFLMYQNYFFRLFIFIFQKQSKIFVFFSKISFHSK